MERSGPKATDRHDEDAVGLTVGVSAGRREDHAEGGLGHTLGIDFAGEPDEFLGCVVCFFETAEAYVDEGEAAVAALEDGVAGESVFVSVLIDLRIQSVGIDAQVPQGEIPKERAEDFEEKGENAMQQKRLVIEVEGKVLEENAATRELVSRLPLTLDFADLYGRELCHRFRDALPTDDVRVRGYEVGEIVYWPPRHSFVILYRQNGEAFDMQSIGRMTGDWSTLPRRDFRATLRLE